MSKLSVACIGLGRMGSGIAGNIQKHGFPLTVYNRSTGKTAPFVSAGAVAARTPRGAAAAAEIVVTNLMDDASVLDTMSGGDGILAGMRPGAIHIGTTTISPNLSARLAAMHAAHGSHYIAGPVAGRPDAAAAGKLITFLAGKPEPLERSRPVISAYADRIIPMGEDPAAANSMKLVGNFMVASIVELIGQVYVFAEKRGVDPAIITGMFKQFMPATSEYVDRISTRNFKNAGFTLDAGLKDVTLILAAAAEVQTPLPYASIVRDKCLAAQARGMNQLDWSALTEISRLNAGQE
ncbi:MAG TPA: NAD(P)-dependent oxidoreductase [Verrucomicrobiae bacterium]|jgi:3-hydroxyisobutyrate dehydrogenase-like beta-hydroxyacid dehydrogenase|nr:NAD(P)-dependent oxidoreductase [Verrucomicrobiae bacterium]